MKLSQTELVVVGLLIVYIAFFSHPAPAHLKDFLSSPVGHAIFLLGVLYITVYKSLIVGVFMGIAYVMTASSTTEYLDPKEQAPKEKEQPKSAGVPAPTASLKDMLSSLKGGLQKGDTVAHAAVPGKSVTAPPAPSATPKPAAPSLGKTTGSFSAV